MSRIVFQMKRTSHAALLSRLSRPRSQSGTQIELDLFNKTLTLKSTLLGFKSGKSDRDSTPQRWSGAYSQPYVSDNEDLLRSDVVPKK